MNLAFEQLYTAQVDYVAASLQRLGVADATVEDLTHDVFVDVLTKLHQYDPARPLRPWLFGFAFRAASAWRGRASTQREIADEVVPELVDQRPGPEALALRSEAAGVVGDAMSTMSELQRAVFVAHELDGLTMPEISEALGIPLNTAYSRLRLARQQFNRALEAGPGGPP